MNSCQFGDGYAQDAGDGMNNTPEEWSIVVPFASTTDINTIESLLVSAIGNRLLWTPPLTGASQQIWRVPETWERTFHSYNVESLSFVLRQAF
jgi:phage-related protein